MNVLLISPNTLRIPYPVYPIGLDYVAGAISTRHNVRIFDLLAQNLEELSEVLGSFQPEIVGISIRNIDNTDAGDVSYYLEEYRQLVRWLRQHTTAIVVGGGSGFTIMPREILTLLELDYGIIGEGERFALLVEALENRYSPMDIPGVVASRKSKSGDTKWHTPPVWQEKLFRRFTGTSPHTAFYLKNGGMLNLQTKRGCTFRCIYCPYPHIEGGKHRYEPPEKVAAAALELQEAGAKYLFFTDSAFNSDIDHSLAVAKALDTAGLAIPWGAFFSPTSLPDEYFAIMAKAGCRHVEFGTESLSDAMLAAYRKPFRAREVFLAHQQASRAGLRIAHYFLLGGPGESSATLDESFEGVERLKQAVFFFFVGIRIYPQTALHRIALTEGQIDETTDLLQPVFYQPQTMPLEAIETVVHERASGRVNWITGSGGKSASDTVRNCTAGDWSDHSGSFWHSNTTPNTMPASAVNCRIRFNTCFFTCK